MLKRTVFERSRREISLDVSVGVHILLVVEQSSLESQSRGCAKTPILTVHYDSYCCKHDTYGTYIGTIIGTYMHTRVAVESVYFL